LKQIKKAIYEREFFKTIERPDKAFEPIDVSQLVVGSEYDGPVFESVDSSITPEWYAIQVLFNSIRCVQLMDYFKA